MNHHGLNTLEECLNFARSGEFKVQERIPAVETDSYYRMIEFRKDNKLVRDFPLSRYDYQQYRQRSSHQEVYQCH